MKLILPLLLCGLLPCHAQQTQKPWQVPADFAAPDQKSVDMFAWQAFVALNWPAKEGVRGEPDTDKKIGDSGSTVWETFKTTDQIFLSGAKDPGPWNPAEKLKANAFAHRKMFSTSKISPALLGKLPELATQKLGGVQEAVGGTLTDQNGNLTYFERSTNELGYDYIRSNQFYNADVLAKASEVDFPDSTVNIKAAWKILEAKDPVDKFYTTTASINGEDKTMGLVGLHIVVKTPNAPQWVWATFEHVSNAPTFSNLGEGPYSYNNPECPPAKCPPNQSTEVDGKPTGKPTQVVREVTIYESAQNANQAWQKALQGTVWKNYELVGTQWPTVPNNPSLPTGRPQPTLLGNTTMETYIQRESSCLQCHSTAHSEADLRYDFSFYLMAAQKPDKNEENK
ncbi:hypothetical protein Rhal01_02704 [Rubritalea halochordaticola]|uniref:Cytochrome P460 domain-containing protein n=1 Tax=Rubritalea halochordaticola TaxID=714537 RepID=A0ABP9V3E2_9BACT